MADSGSSDVSGDSPDYANLDISFDDLLEPSSDFKADQKSDTEVPDVTKPAPPNTFDDELHQEYILGTLIVRVVAAKDIEGIVKGNNIGNAIFGGPKGSSNPYASVRFGSSTQRTSQVFGTLDPIWPRSETMYMDVSHPSFVDVKTLEDAGDKPPSKKLKQPPDHHPGNPPEKPSFRQAVERITAESTLDSEDAVDPNRPRPPILTIALFHSSNSDVSALKYNPQKNGDSNDTFLGMASIDVSWLLTGKTAMVDEWLPLAGSRSEHASVRIVCEYEASDAPPQKSDLVRFTGYCLASDVYPAHLDRIYQGKCRDRLVWYVVC